MAMGTPGAMPVSNEQVMLGGGAAGTTTVLGVAAPTLGSYAPLGHRSPASSQPPYGARYGSSGGYPAPGPGGAPGMPIPGTPRSGSPTSGGYLVGGVPALPPYDVRAIEQRPMEGKRSTLFRDITIGVVIAAVVLTAFMAVKLFVLDGHAKSSTNKPTSSSFATIRLALPAGITVQLFVDGKVAAAAVRDRDEVPLNAGTRSVKLLGPGGQICEEPIKLEAGQVTTIKCEMFLGTASGSSSTGPAAAADVAPGSAAPAIQPKGADVKAPEATPGAQPTTVRGTTPTPTKGDANNASTGDSASPAATESIDPSMGYLVITSKPMARIVVDGTDTGRSTPITSHSLALVPGKHKVTFVIGDARYSYPVIIKAGQTETMTKDLQ
jgi:hypothetical protein